MTDERVADLRRHPRARVSWPVTVEAGGRRVQLQTVNLSPLGAKLKPADPLLQLGTEARLRFAPPSGDPLEVMAIVWRLDPDGPAFFFTSVENQDFVFPAVTPEPAA